MPPCRLTWSRELSQVALLYLQGGSSMQAPHRWLLSVLLLLSALILSTACGSDPAPTKVQRLTSPRLPVVMPVHTSMPSLGVSRRDIQSIFENSAINFTFENAPLADGTPRIMGTSSNSLAILDLIGPPADLTEVSITVGVPSDAPEVIVMNAAYMMGLIKNTLPGWSGSNDWLEANLPVAQRVGKAQTSYGNAVVTLSVIEALGMVMLSISAEAEVTHLREVLSTPTPLPAIGPTPDIKHVRATLEAIDTQKRMEEQATRTAVEAAQEAAQYAASLEATRVAQIPTPTPAPTVTPQPTATPHPSTYCREWEALVMDWIKEGNVYMDYMDVGTEDFPSHPKLTTRQASSMCINNFPVGKLQRGSFHTVGTGQYDLLPGRYQYESTTGDNRIDRRSCTIGLNEDGSPHGWIFTPLTYGEPFEFIVMPSYHSVKLSQSCSRDGFLRRVGD